MYQVATIGSSWITDTFLGDLMKADVKAAFTAVLTGNFEKGRAFAKKYGVETVYTDIEDLAGSDVDAVYIATPVGLHYQAAKKLLQAGKHVLCEKTSVVTGVQIDELYRIAEEQGVIFMEAIRSMYYPEVQTIKDNLHKLGKIHMTRFDFSKYSSKYDAYLRGQTPAVFDPEYAGGGLNDLGIYPVYLVMELFGAPDEITARASFMRTGADVGGTALFTYPDQLTNISWCKGSSSGYDNVIEGEKGTMHIGCPAHIEDVYIDYVEHEKEREVLAVKKDDLIWMKNEIEAFFRFIEGKDKDLYEKVSKRTRDTIHVMERIREAAGIPVSNKCKEL